VKKKRILLVEDDSTLRETIAYNLERQKYKVVQAADGITALAKARKKTPDLIILDVMLPGMDGFEICRVLRKEMNVPIIMLTARADEVDKVVGLEMGADDYMTKPFSMRELVARVKAMLRRVRLMQEALAAEGEGAVDGIAAGRDPVLAFEDLEIDPVRREIRRGESPVHLKPKEFELLYFLARHRGTVLSRDLILQRVWGWDFDGGTRTVDVHVRWLREKIEPDPANPSRIITVRGVGYRFEG
jgi:DNA-binding response OmpR family regulator